MYAGVAPCLLIVYLVYEDRRKPGVLWFMVSLVFGALWALLYATFTLVQSPAITLALANLFWATVPAVAVAFFLFSYEFVFRTVVQRRLVVALFLPIGVLFALSWTNPGNLVFTPEYGIGPDGILYVPPLGGPVKILVTKVYGFLLVAFGAGMLVGETLQSDGLRRRQALYLLLIYVALAASTLVKILGFVPEYFDPTSMVFSISALAFAYSIQTHDLLKIASVAREHAFHAVDSTIFVVDTDDVVVDINPPGRRRFGDVFGESLDDILPDLEMQDNGKGTIDLVDETRQPHFTVKTSPISYGRGLTGRLVVLNDVTTLVDQRDELDLIKQILTRHFRHNIRNEVNVIEGYASELQTVGDETVAEMASIVQARASHLLREAEKARVLERVFTADSLETVSLADLTSRVLDAYRDRPDIEVLSNVDDVAVLVHPQLSLALEELIENAIVHDDGDEPVRVTVSSSVAEDSVVLRLEDTGPGIPQMEIDVLETNEETPLKHSTGIGLWLVKIVVSRQNGNLRIDADTDGSRIEITLQRPPKTANTD